MWLFASALALFLPLAAGAFDEKLALKESQAAIGRVPAEHVFRASDGRSVRLSDLRGTPLVVHFVYTGCIQVCPATTQFLAKAVTEAERALGKGAFRVATVGFNLPFDTPDAMKAFGRKFGIGSPDWLLLTPDAGSLERLAADFGFRYQPTAAGFDHLLQVSILDAEGRIYRQVYGESFEGPLFVGPLVQLAQNSPTPAASLPAWIEQVKILCTVYDPAAGRYRVNYAVLIELAIGASIFLVGIPSLICEWRRRRKAKPSESCSASS